MSLLFCVVYHLIGDGKFDPIYWSSMHVTWFRIDCPIKKAASQRRVILRTYELLLEHTSQRRVNWIMGSRIFAKFLQHACTRLWTIIFILTNKENYEYALLMNVESSKDWILNV